MFARAPCFVVAGRACYRNDVITDENVLRWRRRNGKHVDDLMVAQRIRKHGAFGYPKCGLMFKRNAEICSHFVSFPNSVTQSVVTFHKLHRGGQTKLDLVGSDWVWGTYIFCSIIERPVTYVGRDSSVGIATRYWLDAPGSNLGDSDIFRTRPDRL